ncbi:MAG: ATP-grasp domain-containing protein [Acidimicrobiales bacterium]
MARVLLLVPSATYRAGDFLQAARSLGVDVVVGTEQAHALSDLMGARSLEVPLADPTAAAAVVVAHDAAYPVDAVIAVDDGGAEAAAAAAEQLGLRHNPPDAVASARDKLRMRRRLAAAEVPQPAFAVLAPQAGRSELEAATDDVGFPCVVKPTKLSGSQGVLRADDLDEAWSVVDRVRAIARAAGVAPDAPLLVERFVPGPEVAVEGMLRDGELEVLAVFDKPDPLEGPAFEETIYVTPSRLAHRDLDAVEQAAASAARALGLRQGPIHAELRVERGRATVIEVAVRTIGGLCARALSFGTGHSLEELVIAQALGRRLDTHPDHGAAGVLMIPIPGAGTLAGVSGRDAVLAVPGITGMEVSIAPGRPVAPPPEGNRYLGFVFARGARPDGVEASLREAWACIDVDVVPGDPLAAACAET